MKAIIVDDEPAIRNTISALLRESFPDIIVSGHAGSVEEGYTAVTEHEPDLLFLDVELPDGLGFDLLKRLSPVRFRTIFITGHQEYALDAIKVSALDYILKPIDTDELTTAIEKAREIINHEEEQLKMLALSENLEGKKILKRIILRTSDALQLISVDDIVRAEAESNYTHFHLTGGKHIMVSRTIKEYEAMLSGSGIIRVHQSHLVNLTHIDKFFKHDGGYLQLKDGTTVSVSPNLKQKVLQAITDHLYE
ncbi:MAG: LytTR family DNA-binding domain-containing protein [Bacteroidales bacterium]|nr:LytTR family DNA-binding domain-containing protein [Bacteroidales bacterium]MDT8374808.1 LytTR family DNA-binding domain-containing protein [Bacteroidales bacterium]